MVLGIYYLTDYYDLRLPENKSEEERTEKNPLVGMFSSMDLVLESLANGNLHIKDKIILVFNNEPITTTVGRVMLNSILPERIRFINRKMKSGDLKKVLSQIFDEYDMPTTVHVADDIKDL